MITLKPFAFEELLARVRALIRRPKQGESVVLKVDGLSMNTSTYEVKKDEMTVELSSKEYALLEYLMRHAHQVLHKDQIIAHVWDYDAEILPNTVEVYIRKLREKIDLPDPAKKPLIQTVRGFGYRLG